MERRESELTLDSENENNLKWVIRVRKLSFIVVLIGFLFDLVAVLTPYWISYKDKGYVMHFGIFFSCISDSGRATCGISGGMEQGIKLTKCLGSIIYIALKNKM